MFPTWIRVVLISGCIGLFVVGGAALLDHMAFPAASESGGIPILPALLALLSGLLVGVGVAFHLLRRQLSPFSEPSAREQGDRTKLQWMISLRWVAAAVVTGASGSMGFLGVIPEDVVLRILGWAVLLVGFNLVSLAYQRGTKNPDLAMAVQIGGDLILLTLLLSLAGGTTNPLISLYLVHVVLSAILLGVRAAYLTATGAALLLILLASATWNDWVPRVDRLLPTSGGPYPVTVVLAHIALMYTLAYLAGILSRRLRTQAEDNARLATGIEKEKARLLSAVEQMSDGVMFTDIEGKPTLINPTMKRLWGSPLDEGVMACHPKERQESVSDLMTRIADGEAPPLHLEVKRDGRTLETTIAPIRSEAGEVQGIIVVTRDVTENLRMREEMIRQEKRSVLERLAGAVAHDLNNPLSAIAMFAELIQKDRSVSDEARDHAATIVKNSLSCKRIAKTLLSYNVPTDLNPVPVDVREAMQDTADLLRPLVEKERAELTLPPENGMLEVMADPDQLRQVFTNILMNAVRAVEGRDHRRIAVGIERRNGHARVSVQDTGPGIAPEDQKKIFEPFFTTRKDGTGLGLSIVGGVIGRHDGRVWVESTPGHGATFFVELPVHEPGSDR